ncbi:MAG: hypothetical protein P8N60_01550, partial [Burkholderiaceae bacterium]|nr:hypothetical protein [Burkholderiaceae bacterium]
YYYSYVSALVLLGFVVAARWDFQPKHPSYSNVGHFMWCDGRVARERKILTEYGIENPRVDGSIPSQATNLKSPFQKWLGLFSCGAGVQC